MSPSITKVDDENDQNASYETYQNPRRSSNIPNEIIEIFEYLSTNSKIVFKSQQRNEPELLLNEKVKLAQDIYERNPQTFLLRFGTYLQEKHLQNFARLAVAQSDQELHHIVRDYQTKLKTREQDIKNRRYAALQKLIKEGEYFSEQEMMKRAPELYQELVGQYLSLAEIKERDSYDVRNTSFSGILIHTMECKELSEVLEKAKEQLENETETQEDFKIDDNTDGDQLDNFQVCQNQCDREDLSVPASYRQQWGNFDNESIACSSTRLPNMKKKTDPPFTNNGKSLNNLITAGERELLKQEFISLMHERFLTEQDEDFDYSTVDDNTNFDDLQQINQDKEDKYFAESDDDNNVDDVEAQTTDNEMFDINEDNARESEDELDIYMNHLSKHHSLQKQ
ncbi:coiled-coil domain-containing protein 97 [Glossina fuscipes fuscipes]